jgi:hypothetical protein
VAVSFLNGQHAVVREAVSVAAGRFVVPTLATAVVPALVLQNPEGKEVGRFNAAAIVGDITGP